MGAAGAMLVLLWRLCALLLSRLLLEVAVPWLARAAPGAAGSAGGAAAAGCALRGRWEVESRDESSPAATTAMLGTRPMPTCTTGTAPAPAAGLAAGTDAPATPCAATAAARCAGLGAPAWCADAAGTIRAGTAGDSTRGGGRGGLCAGCSTGARVGGSRAAGAPTLRLFFWPAPVGVDPTAGVAGVGAANAAADALGMSRGGGGAMRRRMGALPLPCAPPAAARSSACDPRRLSPPAAAPASSRPDGPVEDLRLRPPAPASCCCAPCCCCCTMGGTCTMCVGTMAM
mmetsp:Transcript_9480/g.23484  ORF Transcript_9480/g.23484 Transcript_9480/m.23484 type:complete len:287 (-) Transcript_9480:948-1808(-)